MSSSSSEETSASKRLKQISNHLQQQQVVSPIETMKRERQKASFNPLSLTYFLDGSVEMAKLKQRILLEIERDPLFQVEGIYDWTKEQWREETMRKFKSFVHHLSNESIDVFRLRMELVSLVDPGFWTRIGVHYGLFFGTLRGQATAEQFQFWVGKGAMSLSGFVGCFAMTEMGHGSNVAGLETTAEFDHASDEFVINTPTLTATKWWIGGAAHSATHAAVYARLIVEGKDYGVKPFVVPLRYPQDYTLKPGINIGDIGMKMGRNGIDNGWIQFTNVRIPRTFMLMKYTKVSREGKVTEPPLSQLAYGALILGRVSMVTDSANVAKKALTIAIRYGAVRRQFSTGTSNNDDSSDASNEEVPSSIETQLLDYTIHQYRLMPLLAQAFAMHFTGREMNAIYEKLMERLDRLNDSKSSDKKEFVAVVDSLKEAHATSAGLKAFCTWNTLNTIEQCRQALGGHGYSSYTGLAQMYNDFAVQCSWEGDNTILTLQAGRYLINCYKEVREKKKTQPMGVYYLNSIIDPSLINTKSDVKTVDDLTLGEIANAFAAVRASVVVKLGTDYDRMLAKLGKEEALEEVSIKRLFAARIHTVGYLFDRFRDGIQKCEDKEVKSVLTDVCLLYGLYNINENGADFMQTGYFSPEQMVLARELVLQLCRRVREQAIPLVDSFNLPDYVINSPFGRFDGDVYRHYFEKVKSSNPPTHPPPYFERIIKPVIFRKDDDKGEPEDIEE